MWPLRWLININSSFIGFAQVSTKATQTNKWKIQSNFFQYSSLSAFLLSVFTAAIPHFCGIKGKKEGEENGGGRSTPALLLPRGWRIQSLLAFLQDTQPTNTYFKVKEKEEEEVWGRKGRQAQERKEKETQTDRPAGRLTETECQGQSERERERKKESRWYRQQNEQVIEVKWEWEQERKKRRGDLREIKHGLCATEVRRQTSMLWQPAGTSPADRLCCFPICSEERHSPTWGRVKASRWDCLRQMKQGVFWCHLERTKAWFPVLPVTQRVLCSLLSGSRLFVVRAVNNYTHERWSYRDPHAKNWKICGTFPPFFWHP